jgi:hypothetical protein
VAERLHELLLIQRYEEKIPMKTNIAASALALLISVACNETVDSSPSEKPAPIGSAAAQVASLRASSVADVSAAAEHKAVIHENSGKVALYSGWKAGERIRGRGVPQADNVDAPFARVRVPRHVFDAVQGKGTKMQTFSMEDPRNDIEVTVHLVREENGVKQAREMVFRAGDPWISGVVQVVATDDGVAAGFYSIVRHHPPIAPNGQITASYFESVIVNDPEMPALRYVGGDTSRWPARPANWN